MDKIQELTQKLYDQGLAKGKEEAQALLAKAREEAQAILKKAEEEAQAILEKARREAADYRTQVEGDVKMAATQSLQATRSTLEEMVVAKAVAPAGEILSESGYLKEIITAVAKRFSSEESADLSLVLPEKLQKELEPFIQGELAKTLGKGLEATFSKKVSGGFRIGPKDGSYFISLTDESFKQLIGAYLRPATRQILFG
jgi:V/A-type H+-transporting ATPase subunit E